MTPFWVCCFFLTLTRALGLQRVLSPVATQKDGSFSWLYSEFLFRQTQGRTYLELAKELVFPPSCQPALVQTLGGRSPWVLGVHSGWAKSYFFATSLFWCMRGINAKSYWDLFLGVFGCHPLWFQVQYNCSWPNYFPPFGITQIFQVSPVNSIEIPWSRFGFMTSPYNSQFSSCYFLLIVRENERERS